MVSLRGYIINNFLKSFMVVFIPFFVIISLVYLVRISALTVHIDLSFTELLLLFSYTLPDIIFYTLPLSFIAALTNTFIRLSTDNELIALYALGTNANRIVRMLIPLSVLSTLLLLSLAFMAMPMSKQFYKAFKHQKRSEAKLNISPGKLGQKFGDFYVYIKDKNKDGSFNHLVIYNRTNINDEQFFVAEHGKIQRKDNQTSLLLQKGYGYTYQKDFLQQAQYEQLEAFDTAQNQPYTIQSVQEYIQQSLQNKRMRHRFLFYIFISFIPLLALYPVAAFSMINPRYQGNHALSIIFLTTFILYLVASSLKNWGTFFILPLVILLTLYLGYKLFKKRVARYF